VDIHIAQPFAHQAVAFDKRQRFFVIGFNAAGQRLKKRKEGRSVFKIPTGKFSDNQWMAEYVSMIEKVGKFLISIP